MLTDKSIKLLNKISFCLGTTCDVLDCNERDETDPEFARGYIQTFSKYSDDETVLLIYFVIKNIMSKLNSES